MDKSKESNLGEIIKQQRVMMSLTLQELAHKAGVSSSHLGRIERGERLPSGKVLRKIAKALELDESLLMVMAGYLSPQSSSETGEEPGLYRRLDPYVAKVLSEEPAHIQQAVVSLLTIVKAIAKSPVH